jgi:hypothetical protein
MVGVYVAFITENELWEKFILATNQKRSFHYPLLIKIGQDWDHIGKPDLSETQIARSLQPINATAASMILFNPPP